MTSIHNCFALVALTLSTPTLFAGDLSVYRDFKLGMNVTDANKTAGMDPSQIKLVHQRPALIQQFEWRPGYIGGDSAGEDSVKDVILSFYNDQLFRITVNYDRYKIEGMTAEDFIDAISLNYGAASAPNDEIMLASSYSLSYGEKTKVIARWEDSEYSFNLVRSPYQPGFVLIGIWKKLDTLAQVAALEARRLDEQEAPQREADERRKQADEAAGKQKKARLANKPGFRP